MSDRYVTFDLAIKLDQGTLILDCRSELASNFCASHAQILSDPRFGGFRALASSYRDIVMDAAEADLRLVDNAKHYDRFPMTVQVEPRRHQQEALEAWLAAGRQGVVELPTGSGKTILAVMAMAATHRPTLIVVPTIELIRQWQSVIKERLNIDAGALGGGEKSISEVTVATFESAVIFLERLQGLFGMLVVDECHHLGAPQYLQIAKGLIAPFRLGLSATVARADGKESEIFRYIGTQVFAGRVSEMVETVLAPFDVVEVEVALTSHEAASYQDARSRYTAFLRSRGINMGHPQGWMHFVQQASRSQEGRDAMRAFRLQKSIAHGSETKFAAVWDILKRHPGERAIIFTNDNDMAYRLGERFILPVLTHHTKLAERKRLLADFKDGAINVLVTSKVLNEGVDVPDASIGIVVSGSGGVREHVQRLGRILRHRPHKRAVLYEIIAKNTGESRTNQRRKQHDAYQGPHQAASERRADLP